MNIPLPSTPGSPSLETLQAGFLSLLPRVELHARVYFRGLKCPHRKEDAIQEVGGRLRVAATVNSSPIPGTIS